MELGLRIGGYGYPTGFFLKTQLNGQSFYIENQKFGLRFFPPELARSPAPIRMPADKANNTFRIFLLGESAALGDPEPAYGVGRYLQVFLGERYPARNFEVICVAMTAINSHAILPIARECARQQGDLWVIYAGNNEMEGPFGAGTIFGPRAPSLMFIRASLALKATRVGQLLDSGLRRWTKSSSTSKSWKGMGMFLGHQTRHNEPARKRIHEHFKKNLERIVDIGQRSGAQVILSTVASNLKDCPPFASLHSTRLGELQTTWDQLYQKGKDLEAAANFFPAAANYSAAAALDPDFAELQYRLGHCQLAQSNLSKARHFFELARDSDALPFRADSRINQIINEVGQKRRNRNVYALDAVSALSLTNFPGIPGHESFYEHVHLNFEGNYVLARAIANRVSSIFPGALGKESQAEWAAPGLCARRLAISDWNRYRVYESILRRVSDAPFTNQLHYAARQNLYREKLGQFQSGMNAAAAQESRATFQGALSKSPDDFFLHQKFAEFLELAGDIPGASDQWRKVTELIPQHPIAYFQVGRLAARRNNSAEAEEYFTRAIRLRSDFVEAHDHLGQLLAKQKKFAASYRQFKEALRQQPDNATVHFHLADALAADGKRTEAVSSLREAVRLRPGFWEARYLLGVELAVQEKVDEAREQFAEVVRLRSDYVLGHLNLGVALARQGRMQEAALELQETLRLDPQNKSAQKHLDTLRSLPPHP